MIVWRPKILAVGFKSKALRSAFRVVFYGAFSLALGRPYELIIAKYVGGQPPAEWPDLLQKIRVGTIKRIPASVQVVAVSEIPLVVEDRLTTVYSFPREIGDKEYEKFRNFCLERLVECALGVEPTA